MRRTLIALLLTLSLAATACGDDDDNNNAQSDNTTTTAERPTFAAGTTMKKIQDRGKIIVGTKYNQLGSGLKNPTTGELEGFDIEIAKLIAAELFGVEADEAEDHIEFKETQTPVREFSIQNKTVDIIIATYTINDARKQAVDFAGPYLIDGQTAMVQANNTTIKTLTDLNGKKVCTARNSTTPANLTKKNITASLSLLDGYPECAAGLRQGRYDAVVTDRGILLGLVEQGNGAFKLANVDVSEEPLGIGLLKGDDAFREFLNDTLEKIFEDGSWAKAYEATLGELGLETPEPPEVDRYAGTGPSQVTATTGVTTPPATSTTTATGGRGTATSVSTTTTR